MNHSITRPGTVKTELNAACIPSKKQPRLELLHPPVQVDGLQFPLPVFMLSRSGQMLQTCNVGFGPIDR